MIYSVITESVLGLAFWTASLVIVTFIVSSGLISRGVYPKLLQEDKQDYLSDSIRLLFYFSILFTALVITFGKPGLFALNPNYADAELVVVILGIQIFLYTISANLQTFITGIEKVDVDRKSSFRDYYKSKLFFIPTITIIQSLSYVVLLIIVLSIASNIITSQIELLVYWAMVSLVIQIPVTIYTVILFRKHFISSFKIKSITKYFFAGIFSFGFIHIILNNYLQYNIEVFKFLPEVLMYALLGIFLYIGITVLIDSKTRILLKNIINVLKK